MLVSSANFVKFYVKTDVFFPLNSPCFYGLYRMWKKNKSPNFFLETYYIKKCENVFYNILNPALGPLAAIEACILSFCFFVNMNSVVSSE